MNTEQRKLFTEWLTKKHLTTKAFSKATCIDQSTVEKWRTGKNTPRPICKMAIALVYKDCPLTSPCLVKAHKDL